MEKDMKQLYDESIVIDASCPLCSIGDYSDLFLEGGVTVLAASLQPTEGILADIAHNVIYWYDKINRDPEHLMLIRSADDIIRAKKENKMGVFFFHDNCQCLQGEIGMLELYYNLGLRQQGLCYNYRNSVGDGCSEPSNGGLSLFGEKCIKEMNRLGIAIDLSHVGERTSLEALEVSTKPMMFSHSNSKEIYDNNRNITDEQALRCAKNGGIIGVNAISYFIGRKKDPTLNDLIDHLDHYVKLVGIDHVCLGLDYYKGSEPFMSFESACTLYEDRISRNIWDKDSYPAPPWRFPKEIETPTTLYKWVPALRVRGYADSDIKKILGENLLNYYRQVW